MNGRRGRALAYAIAGLAIVLIAFAFLRKKIEVGDVDPVSAVIGLASLVLSAGAFVLAWRAWRWQSTATDELVAKLATLVENAERKARRQLLGNHDRIIDVAFDFRPARVHNAEGAAERGQLHEVAEYFQKLKPRRMVITGAGGSGKTVLVIELILALLESRPADDPVPVRVPATSWDQDTDDDLAEVEATDRVRQWLVNRLVDAFQMSPASAEALVDAGRVIPVVDGLDELDATEAPGYASRAGQTLRMFNAYQRSRSKAELIVTCRTGQYEALSADDVWMEDAARVEIRPVTTAQARSFITSRVRDEARWEPLLAAIESGGRSGPLARALSTPWRLTLATTVYEQRDAAGRYHDDPARLAAMAGTPAAIRDHLLSLFIPAVLHSAGTRYDPAQAHRWLGVLAGYLQRNLGGRNIGGRQLSGTDIVLHELWPLGGITRPRSIGIAILAVVWVIAIPIMLTQVPIGFTTRQLIGALGPLVLLGYLVLNSWFEIWPIPHRLSFAEVREAGGWQRLLIRVALGLVGGVVLGAVLGLVATPLLGLGAAAGFTFSTAIGIAVATTLSLASGVTAEVRIGATNPRTVVRDDLVAGLGTAVVVGVAIGLAVSINLGLVFGLAFGLAAGITTGLASGPTGGSVGFRYITFLLCTRRWNEHALPWRLGRFLDVCYAAGLVRVAGNAYQFRHRELQDYLAKHPVPEPVP